LGAGYGMTIAAQQCREYIEAKYPGVRISRQSCRDTASGKISQHSAYQPGGYDSNALDIMGGPRGWTWEQNVELIQQVVDDLTPNLTDWSIRKILWKVAAHYGHAHIDFHPMIDIHKWCATVGVTPPWEYSDGHIERHLDPEPENGRYDGEDMSYETFRAAEFDLWTDENIMDAWDRGRFQDTNRGAFEAYWVTDRGNRTNDEKARFMTDFYSSGTP
jgi:hypothetical protein